MFSREDRVRMERAHVSAWPALRTATIDGWLWRSSGGGSQRANSVSTVDYGGSDVAASIAVVEARYAVIGAPARFHCFDETSPAGLADMLVARGYRQAEPTTTMVKRPGGAGAVPGVVVRCVAWPEWRGVYLGEITENRRLVNAMILDRIPEPRAFFGYQRDHEVVATALCAVSHGCAVIECVATRADSRRQGAAQSVLAAIENWVSDLATLKGQRPVDWIGLQVASGNSPAIALYQRLGFVAVGTNRFWVR